MKSQMSHFMRISAEMELNIINNATHGWSATLSNFLLTRHDNKHDNATYCNPILYPYPVNLI